MKLTPIAVAILTTNLLASCGGGGGSQVDQDSPISTTPDTSTGTTPPAIIIKTGFITGFGSIYIDGQRYLTDTSTISVNNQLGQDVSSLKVGMKISLAFDETAEGETPEANEVHYENDIEGVITAIDRNNSQLLIAGTVVSFNDLTHFINVSEAALNVGDRVEVSGYFDSTTRFIATYIELDDYFDNDSYEYTTGAVSAHDTANKSFSLDGLTVDYSGASINGQISDDVSVTVSGTLSDDVLIANDVETHEKSYRGDFSQDGVAHYEVEGIITAYDTTAKTVTINGVRYSLAANVQIVGGTTFAVQSFVEVAIDSTTNEIYEIELKNRHTDSDGRVKGVISAIDSTERSITLSGQRYLFTNSTRVEADDNQYFNFDSLQANDRVEIVFVSNNGVLEIQRIERASEQEYSEEWELKGTASDVDSATQSLRVNGILISLTSTVRYLVGDFLTTAEAFFTQLIATPTLYVEVDGYYDSNGNFIATKIELSQSHSSEQESSGSDNDSNSSGDSDSGNDHGHDVGSDNDDKGVGYVELEGRVSSVLSSSSFMLNNREIRLDSSSKLEINDNYVTLADFMAQLTVNTKVEIEGYWTNSAYVYALEAEIEY